MEPRHLLLDEVTSALDPEMTAEVLIVIERLAKAGTTMILVTHDGIARRVADRAIFMEAGRLVADQPIRDFFGNAQGPAHPALPDQDDPPAQRDRALR
jgi:ABC-type polar amino acid transport system ATPase subunit